MNANVVLRFGCITCVYFTDNNCHMKQHLLTKKHIRNMQPKIIDANYKYQCKICEKKYHSQQGLWNHNRKCYSIIPEIKNAVTNSELQEQMMEMKKMMKEIKDNPSNVTNNNININIFLNEKCSNAMEMSDFIKGIQFCADNFTSSNLLIANALEHTVQIFQNRFNEMTLQERPIHNFPGEDRNQLVAHYRHNNEWKSQSELSILDEIYRDYEGNEPNDSLVHYLAMFHKRRLTYFNETHDKRNHLGTNLRFTTYPEQQIDLARKLLEIVKVSTDLLT